MTALKQLREARHLTQRELAERARISLSRMAAAEQQTPIDWLWLERLARVLGCSSDAILELAPVPVAPPDAIGRAERELLDAMRRDAEAIIGDHPLLKRGGWLGLARTAWLGVLFRIRDHGVDRARLPAPVPVDERAQRRVKMHRAKAAV